MRVKFPEKLFDIFNYLFLSILSLTFLFPFWRAIVISLNEGIDSGKGGIAFWPRRFTLDNYIVIFSKSDIIDAYTVTIARTVIGTVFSVLLVSMMAYGLSKNYLKGRKAINIMILVTMFFSGGLIPTYMLYNKLDLLDNFLVYVIPSLYGAGGIFIFRSFFRSLSGELEESAKIDGASDPVIFFWIVIPLSLPIIATMSLFTAVGHWNDYMSSVLFTTDRRLMPLQTLLMRIISSESESGKMLQQGAITLIMTK